MAEILLLLLLWLLFREELFLEKVRNAIVFEDDFLNVKEKEWCLREILFRERWLVPLFDLLEIEYRLPLRVWLVR